MKEDTESLLRSLLFFEQELNVSFLLLEFLNKEEEQAGLLTHSLTHSPQEPQEPQEPKETPERFFRVAPSGSWGSSVFQKRTPEQEEAAGFLKREPFFKNP